LICGFFGDDAGLFLSRQMMAIFEQSLTSRSLPAANTSSVSAAAKFDMASIQFQILRTKARKVDLSLSRGWPALCKVNCRFGHEENGDHHRSTST
jgi:hypothetical protein